MLQKIKLYIVSLWFLFFLLFIEKVEIPMDFSVDAKFIGFRKLLYLNPVPTFALVFMILGLFFYTSFNRSIRRGAHRTPEKITNIDNINSETLSFLATYIIPLACVDLDTYRSIIVLGAILTLVGWIYIKTNLFYTNPTLSILKFKVYNISTAARPNIIVVTKDELAIDDFILPRPIEGGIFYAKKR